MVVAQNRGESPHCDAQRAERILIVDDEMSIRDVLSRTLTAAGYDCHEATDGVEAWQQIQEGDYALVLCDILMPKMSGVDLLHLVHDKRPSLGAIMLTAPGNRDAAFRSLSRGAHAYMIKPFNLDEVLTNVASVLERRRASLEAEEHLRHLEEAMEEQTAEVRRREEEITLRLVAALEYRDWETGTHTRRIGLYASALAEALGWDAQTVRDIRTAAPMHDIGKIGIPDAILLKPGKLTDEEMAVVKGHPEMGAAILGHCDIPLVQMAKDIALSHHERWNGSGYPHKLQADQTPATGRLVALVDMFDALVNRRVYRPPLSEEDALNLMREEHERGGFDAPMYDCFLDVLPQLRQISRDVSAETAESMDTP